MNTLTQCNPRFNLDDVRGEIVGNVSFRYSATLHTVEVWPRHGSRTVYPARLHQFWSDHANSTAALAEYIDSKRQESRLGDGSPCIVTLEKVTP